MRHLQYWFFLLVSLFISQAAAQSLDEKREKVDELINLNLPHTAKIPPDSVISWGNELAKDCVARKDYDKYFALECVNVFAYILKGENTKALERADLMQKKAEEWNSDKGRAIAFFAIGYAFIHSGMEAEGLRSMAIAIKLFETLPTEYDRVGILFVYVPQLCKAGKMEEARKGLEEMKLYFEQNPKSSPFRYLICLAYFNLHSGKLQQTKQILQQCAALPEIRYPFFQYLLWSVETDYRIRTGEYNRALQLLDSCNTYFNIKQSSWEHLVSLRKRIPILSALGQKQKAIEMYQALFEAKDAQKATYYTRLVHSISANYNASQMELKNQERRNQTVMLYIAGSVMLILVSVLLLFNLKKANRKLKNRQLLLEEARRKAEESMLNKSLFLSNMTHDIRTPLNALSGFSELLVESEWDEATRNQFNDLIQRNSNLLLKLIDDVVDLSNLKTGKMEFSFASCDAIALCSNVIETIAQVKQTEAKVVFETSLTQLEIVTDEARLQQLLINLLINATKFTPLGTITLRLEMQDKETALFSVTDTGCGVSPEQQELIFKRFEKADEQSSGFGIGLSICKLIVGRIKGRIWLDKNYHEGARFLVTHPLCPPKTTVV